MFTIFPKRPVNLAGFAACAGLLAYAYFLQFSEGLEPCPLCIFQRVAFIAMGLLFLLAALHNPGRVGGRIYALLLGVAGLAGTAIAGRHVWLQNLPPEQVPECGPGLEYMLEAFPLTDALRMAFTGSGECASVDWVFLGLSMPAWALLWLVGLALAGVVRNWLPDR
jgi:disulfide bond formation protein DsbB